MTDDLALPCSTHEDAAAAFQCCECGKHLCHDCAEQSSHLVICRLCGERAITLDELDRASPEGSVFASEPSPDTGPYAPSARRSVADNFPTALPASRQRVQALDHPGLALTNHLLIPAATIAMVAALLFFLLDVRSVFLGGTARLKWIGFWFAVATVLIARYGRMTRDAAQQGCYTSALALATLVAMTYAPYESSQSGLGGPLFNLVLILAIWRFASRLTANLSLEGAAPGINERRSRPSAADRRPGARRRPGANGRPETPNRTNPNVAVARLAVLVLILFAVGEPFLLAGPPAAAERALAAMIVFLFSTGVVLASAWGLHTYQRVQALGGEAPPAAIAGRPLAGALAMLTVLAVALTLPGIDHRGSGQLGPTVADRGTAGGDEPGSSSEGEQQNRVEDPNSSEGQGRSDPQTPQRDARTDDSRSRSGGGKTMPTQLLSSLSALGEWLRYPFLFAVVGGGLYGLWRLRSALGRWLRGWHAGLGNFFARLFAGLRGWLRPRNRRPRHDPLADLTALRQGEPQAAVLDAYGRLLAVFEQLGHPRRQRQTPYELLAGLPKPLQALAEPANRLTEAYVAAAYSGRAVGEADRQAAIAALERVSTLRAKFRHE